MHRARGQRDLEGQNKAQIERGSRTRRNSEEQQSDAHRSQHNTARHRQGGADTLEQMRNVEVLLANSASIAINIED